MMSVCKTAAQPPVTQGKKNKLYELFDASVRVAVCGSVGSAWITHTHTKSLRLRQGQQQYAYHGNDDQV